MVIDTVDKIVKTCFAAVSLHSFEYKGIKYIPASLAVLPELGRGFMCPEGCGGCCRVATLDYLPSEQRPSSTTIRRVKFDGRTVFIYSDRQADYDPKDQRCKHMLRSNGRCEIYETRPFSCDFQPIWFVTFPKGKSLRTGRYPNGDKMKRTDGGIGAKCGEIGMLSPNTEAEADRYFGEAVRKLRRLQKWTDHFGLKETLLPDIIHWAQDTERRRHVLNFG